MDLLQKTLAIISLICHAEEFIHRLLWTVRICREILPDISLIKRRNVPERPNPFAACIQQKHPGGVIYVCEKIEL
jgi:hypothetical protein